MHTPRLSVWKVALTGTASESALSRVPPLVEEGIGVSVSMMAFWLAGSSYFVRRTLSRFALLDASFSAYFEAFGFSALFAIFWHLEGIGSKMRHGKSTGLD
ncbi:hypothetical protein C8J56DRAFT_929379 [Mycena floridula]|nr:hypothetical protein C8J56DRAFT_929379 [Mycena floridula]